MRYAKNYWLAFIVAFSAMVFMAATEAAFPAMMKPLLDQGFVGVQSFQVWWVPVAVLLIFFLRGLAGFVSVYAMQWLANNILRDIRQQMFNKLLLLPSATFDTRTSGQFVSRMILESQTVLWACTSVVTVVVRDSLVLIGLTTWLFWLNWKLALVVLLLMPFLAIVTLRFSRRMRRLGRGQVSASGDMTSVIEEAISCNRIIKIYGGQAIESEAFSRSNTVIRRQAMRLAIAQAFQTPLSQFVAATGVAIILTIALIQARAGTATTGDFVSFITAMLMMFSPLRHLADVNSHLQRGLASAEGVFELLDEDQELDSGAKRFERRAKGDIEFSNVTVRYAMRDASALQAVNLRIPAGKTYAFVGPSGGGKSTLANLIPRLYDPEIGAVFIDGIEVREFELRSLRSQIALVSQDVVLFNDTIRNNILYGAEKQTEDLLDSVIEMADLRSFINGLPRGLDTEVGERGIAVSGGQRQRIAIARAIIKDAPILILDEATSALDNESEASVKTAIDSLRRGRTTILVAHRLSTVKDADRIIVLDQGVVLQQGTHEELIDKEGLYRSLYASAHYAG
jgi:subfamily B ATP-binding cassette protein MsbA